MFANDTFVLSLFGLNIPQAFASALLVHISWGSEMMKVLSRLAVLAVIGFAVLLASLPADVSILTRLAATAEYVIPYFSAATLFCFLTYKPDASSPLRAELGCLLIGIAMLPVTLMLTFDAPCRIIKDCTL
jgi:hypothetical protein